MDQSQRHEEPMLIIQVRPNEIIAINLAIAYFAHYCKTVSPSPPRPTNSYKNSSAA